MNRIDNILNRPVGQPQSKKPLKDTGEFKKIIKEKKTEINQADIENKAIETKTPNPLKNLKSSIPINFGEIERIKNMVLNYNEEVDREKKIANLKKQIQEGKYNITPDKVAQKMIDNLFI